MSSSSDEEEFYYDDDDSTTSCVDETDILTECDSETTSDDNDGDEIDGDDNDDDSGQRQVSLIEDVIDSDDTFNILDDRVYEYYLRMMSDISASSESDSNSCYGVCGISDDE